MKPGTKGAGRVAVWVGLALWAGTARPEIVDKGATGFTSKVSVSVAATPAEVYRKLLEIGSWWGSDHTYSGDSRNLYVEAKPGGCFCEKVGPAGGVLHMTVVYVDPGKSLRWTGGLGPLQETGASGALTWALADAQGGTLLTMTYAVGGYVQGGLEAWAGPVDMVLGLQVQRLKAYAETGKPDAGASKVSP